MKLLVASIKFYFVPLRLNPTSFSVALCTNPSAFGYFHLSSHVAISLLVMILTLGLSSRGSSLMIWIFCVGA